MSQFADRRKTAEEYFHALEGHADRNLVPIVAADISRQGFWERVEEWRISSYITSRIEPFEHQGKKWYRLTVKNGTDATCICPTIARAVHYLAIFERLSKDLFWTQGWPSWADKGRLDAEPGEI